MIYNWWGILAICNFLLKSHFWTNLSFLFSFLCFLIWLHWVLVVACRIFTVVHRLSSWGVWAPEPVKKVKSQSCSVVANSLWPHGLHGPWDSPGQKTGVGSLSLPQGIFPPRDWTQVSRTAGGVFTSWASREARNEYGLLLYTLCRSLWVIYFIYSRAHLLIPNS